ncbi:MAG: TRAP transporter large permease subunit [Rhizobiales bacterium]|nr:TRAP transporter large permease subunit [Hyphomicrobiales bacterium]
MELLFLALLIGIMAYALGSGYPVAFALPGAAIVTIVIAAGAGYFFAGNPDAYFVHGGPSQWLSAGVTNFRGIYWEPERDTLIAIPLFVFMGIMLQRSKIAEDLLVTMAQLFGPIPGGLGISVVFVGALLAATTGIVGATVVAMGLISLPAMLRNKYSVPLATGTIAASGTLGQIIPPSIVLIILADQLASAVDQAGVTRAALYKANTGQISMPSDFAITSTSAGEMFLGALVPGVLLVGLYMLFILGLAIAKPSVAPAVHREGAFDRAFAVRVFATLVPPLALIILVLGSIIGGIATVNQAGAIGAVGAMIMAGYRLREGERGAYRPAILAIIALLAIAVVLSFHAVNVKRIETSEDVTALIVAAIAVSLLVISIFWSGWRTLKIEDTLRGVMVETAKTTSLVFIILIGAAMLTAAFRAFGGEDIVREFLQGLPGGFWSQFITVMAVIFVLGFFLDFIEIAVVVVPIVAPILLADPGANITAVWLGVMIGLNIQTSFLTPPFGFALFYLRGVAPASVKTLSIYKGVVAFIGLQLLALVIVGYNPWLVNYLPNRSSLLSETAPPPKNPRLQYCMEEYVADRLERDGAGIVRAIEQARALDVSALPQDLRKKFATATTEAAKAIPAMEAIKEANLRITEFSAGYRPLHIEVRAIERDIGRAEAKLKRLRTIVSQSGDGRAYTAARGELARQEIEEIEGEIAALKARIPDRWQAQRAEFTTLQKAEFAARQGYRRIVDGAYDPLVEVLAAVRSTSQLEAVAADVRGLQGELESLSTAEFEARVTAVRDAVGQVAGAGDIRSAVNKARSAMRGAGADPAKARPNLVSAVQLLDQGLEWRRRAVAEVLPGLESFDAAIRDTIGLRGQPRLPHEQAAYVAACSSHHRDLTLNF